jgi:quercetin dioxygenase-like cupin family protein
MRAIKISDIKPEDKSKEPIFRGKVTIQLVTDLPDKAKEELSVIVVNFSPGATNVFHSHTVPQILYVTEGTGIVATEKEEIKVTPGTFILIPAGEKHWHGATKDSAFSHISITPPGETTKL